PTVREADGLAMSSRNARLKPEERHIALGLWRCLSAARQAFASGQRDASLLVSELRGLWPQEIDLDYLEFRDPTHLDLVSVLEADTRLFLAGWLNGVRLIDNGALRDPR
ncbi:MAG: pantoate--beta-alanine ligase, partial [Acidobacteria bacterium]|nr:pantoate--beta-alanine ligase [Acidobacteriota bacterium]